MCSDSVITVASGLINFFVNKPRTQHKAMKFRFTNLECLICELLLKIRLKTARKAYPFPDRLRWFPTVILHAHFRYRCPIAVSFRRLGRNDSKFVVISCFFLFTAFFGHFILNSLEFGLFVSLQTISSFFQLFIVCWRINIGQLVCSCR